MKTKFILFFILTLFFGALVSRQNELIKIPKEERQLIQIQEKILVGKVARVADGDSLTLDSGEVIRLFGIDAPELNQTCILSTEVQDKDSNETIVKEETIKCGENAKNKLLDLIASNEIKYPPLGLVHEPIPSPVNSSSSLFKTASNLGLKCAACFFI